MIGARRRRSQATGNAILLPPPERLAQAGCSYYERYDARTYLSVPVMPMLRHLRRQKVKFSGNGDLNRIKALDAGLRGGAAAATWELPPNVGIVWLRAGYGPASLQKWLVSFEIFHAMGSVNPVWFSTCKFSIGEVIADDTDHDG